MGMSLNKDRYRVGAALQVYPFRGERGLSGLPRLASARGLRSSVIGVGLGFPVLLEVFAVVTVHRQKSA